MSLHQWLVLRIGPKLRIKAKRVLKNIYLGLRGLEIFFITSNWTKKIFSKFLVESESLADLRVAKQIWKNWICLIVFVEPESQCSVKLMKWQEDEPRKIFIYVAWDGELRHDGQCSPLEQLLIKKAPNDISSSTKILQLKQTPRWSL